MNAKVREHLLALFLVWTLFGCAGIPMPADGIQSMPPGQVVAGVTGIFNGAEPLWWIYKAPGSDLRVMFWPGATNGGETLINMVCLQSCAPGWERIGAGFAMTGAKASEFAAYLKSGGWQQLTPAFASVAAKGQTVGSWLSEMSQSLTGFMLIIPAGIVPPQPTPVQL